MSESEKAATIQKLMQRPSSEEAVAQYREISREIRQELVNSISSLIGWRKQDEALSSGCGFEYPGIGFDGYTWELESYIVEGQISDERWTQAVQIVADIAEKHGFDRKPQILRDKPGDHYVAFHNTHDDGKISFGSHMNTLLQLSVDCHLPAETKRRYESRPSTPG